MREGTNGVIERHSAVLGTRRWKVRKWRVFEPARYAQYATAIAVVYVEARKRSWKGVHICPDDLAYLIIKGEDGTTLYDSRTEIPCDMERCQSTASRFRETYPGHHSRNGRRPGPGTKHPRLAAS